jgi:putative heme degradation protein
MMMIMMMMMMMMMCFFSDLVCLYFGVAVKLVRHLLGVLDLLLDGRGVRVGVDGLKRDRAIVETLLVTLKRLGHLKIITRISHTVRHSHGTFTHPLRAAE